MFHSASSYDSLFPSLFQPKPFISQFFGFQHALSPLYGVHMNFSISESVSASISILQLPSSFFRLFPSVHFFSHFHYLPTSFTTLFCVMEVNCILVVSIDQFFNPVGCKPLFNPLNLCGKWSWSQCAQEIASRRIQW